MNLEEFIALSNLCEYHEVEMSFFTDLNEIGLIEIRQIETSNYLHRDNIADIEKMIRMHRELNINAEGIDVVFNLLKRVEELQQELLTTKNRLHIYELD